MWTRLAILSLLLACRRTSAPEVGPASGSAASAPLDVVAVASKQLDSTVRLPAELGPDEVVAIFPRVNGFVDSITVDRGSVVKKGQVLAQLSAPELGAQVSEAGSKAAVAKSTYDSLFAASKTPGAIAGHDLEVAEAAVKSEQARLASLQALQSYTTVRAPFDGIVSERNVHPGALVGPPASSTVPPMLRVEKIDQLRLTVAVPEADVGAITDGAKASFTVSTWPGETFEGKIDHISHVIDPKTRSMAVELGVDNAKGRLTPGAYAEVTWPVHRTAPSLFVPASAVVQTTERTFVDRVRDGTIDQVTVQRGVAVGDQVEVFGELAAGDQILKRGSETLKPGAKVATKPWAA
ncbi:MAG TPA: efflux RND transporter periplasmic adaptor subunit, partial [Kofleriaceae bacterium]